MQPAPDTHSPTPTRQAILDAAELHFARDGISASSLRAITAEAGVNLAAVNYHFGSKEGLVKAVFERRVQPVNEERLRRLDELEAARVPAVEEIVRVFVLPVMEMGSRAETAHFRRLLGRTFSEPGEEVRNILRGQFQEAGRRFLAALAAVLPGMPPAVLCWRFHFMVGAMVQVAHNGLLILEHSGGLCDPSRTDEVTEQLVAYVAGGLRAPWPEVEALPAAVEVPSANADEAAPESQGQAEDEAEEELPELARDPGSVFPWEDGF